MSVQKMKFVTLTGPVDSFDEVVRHCIIDQEFHPESVLQARRGGRVQPFVSGNPAAPLLRQADELLTRLSLEPRFCPLPEDMTLEEAKATLDELEAHLNDLDSHMAQLRHHLESHCGPGYTRLLLSVNPGRILRDQETVHP